MGRRRYHHGCHKGGKGSQSIYFHSENAAFRPEPLFVRLIVGNAR
jgi:hypothetical protein